MLKRALRTNDDRCDLQDVVGNDLVPVYYSCIKVTTSICLRKAVGSSATYFVEISRLRSQLIEMD